MNLMIYFLIFIIGAIMGSFLGCMGYRIPNKIKTTYPSSFCANCKNSLKWYMNIPVISYIFQKGRCKYCNEKIGVIYFLCEIFSATLFTLSYHVFGFTYEFFISIILICMFIVTIVSDFLYYYISDRVLVIGGLSSLIVMAIFKNPNDIFTSIVSALIIFLFMMGLKVLGNSLFKKESLGDGDIKLMACISLSIGLINSFIVLFISSVLALIYALFAIRKNKDGIIPFGPFLLIGSIIIVLLSNILIPYIENFLSI